jgi:hypothetical protein
VRDAEVMIETIDRLADRYVGQLPEGTLDAFRERLESEPPPENRLSSVPLSWRRRRARRTPPDEARGSGGTIRLRPSFAIGSHRRHTPVMRGNVAWWMISPPSRRRISQTIHRTLMLAAGSLEASATWSRVPTTPPGERRWRRSAEARLCAHRGGVWARRLTAFSPSAS